VELNEAFGRLVLGHWKVLVALLIGPLLVVGLASSSGATKYASAARIQASITPLGSDTEANSVLNRVTGVATSQAIVKQAVDATEIPGRSVDQVSKEITVSRLGSSAVFDLIVTDQSAQVATALVNSLADVVVTFLNSGSLHTQKLLGTLNTREQQLLNDRQQAATTVALAKSPVDIANASAKLATLDQQLTDLQATIRQLQVADATDSAVTVISPATSARAVPSRHLSIFVLAGVAGLIGGLLIAAALEVVRPRVRDARTVARELGAPLLGRLGRRRTGTVGTGQWRPGQSGVGEPAFAEPRLWGSDGQEPIADERKRRRTLRLPWRKEQVASTRPNVLGVSLLRAVQRANVETLVLVGEQRSDLRTAAEELNAVLVLHLIEPVDPISPNGLVHDETRPLVRPVAAKGNGSDKARVTVVEPRLAPAATTGTKWCRIVPFDDVVCEPMRSYALIVLTHSLAPYADVRKVQDLVAATGWSVVGVVDDRRGRKVAG
jgi:capsular polysaccharide biosynthesis protein